MVVVLMCADAHLCACPKANEDLWVSCLPFPTVFPWDTFSYPIWSWASGEQTQAISLSLSRSVHELVNLVRLVGLQVPGIHLCWPPQCGIASVHHHIQVFYMGSKETEVSYFLDKHYTNWTIFPARIFFINICFCLWGKVKHVNVCNLLPRYWHFSFLKWDSVWKRVIEIHGRHDQWC